jgi:very-short-patch-repair endonuclease
MNKKIAIAARETSRKLRRGMTASERILWNELRNRKLSGKKFLRQHPIFCDYEGKLTFFVADFYCHSNRLVIEVDGEIHDYQHEQDAMRTTLINSKGIQVVRFENRQIEQELPAVLQRLRTILTRRQA